MTYEKNYPPMTREILKTARHYGFGVVPSQIGEHHYEVELYGNFPNSNGKPDSSISNDIKVKLATNNKISRPYDYSPHMLRYGKNMDGTPHQKGQHAHMLEKVDIWINYRDGHHHRLKKC